MTYTLITLFVLFAAIAVVYRNARNTVRETQETVEAVALMCVSAGLGLDEAREALRFASIVRFDYPERSVLELVQQWIEARLSLEEASLPNAEWGFRP